VIWRGRTGLLGGRLIPRLVEGPRAPFFRTNVDGTAALLKAAGTAAA